MLHTAPVRFMRDRRKNRFLKAYAITRNAVGKNKARIRLAVCYAFLASAPVSWAASYVWTSTRGNNLAQEVALLKHAQQCAHILPPNPPGYKPPVGVLPPPTKACPPMPEVAPVGEP